MNEYGAGMINVIAIFFNIFFFVLTYGEDNLFLSLSHVFWIVICSINLGVLVGLNIKDKP